MARLPCVLWCCFYGSTQHQNTRFTTATTHHSNPSKANNYHTIVVPVGVFLFIFCLFSGLG